MKNKKKLSLPIYTSTESVIPVGPEKRLLALICGAEPLNESEIEMVKQIKEIKEQGHIIDIPCD